MFPGGAPAYLFPPTLQCGRVWTTLMRRQSPPPAVAMGTVAGSSAGPEQDHEYANRGRSSPAKALGNYALICIQSTQAPARPWLLPKAAATLGGAGGVTWVPSQVGGGQNTWSPFWGGESPTPEAPLGGGPQHLGPSCGGLQTLGNPQPRCPPLGGCRSGGSQRLPCRGQPGGGPRTPVSLPMAGGV